ncbi:macrophage mannose receptor 1-like isoform X2 [Glandiceps talaboti]
MIGLQCPVGWVPFQSSCYWFSDGEFVTWSEASEACCQLGSVLAVPDSEEENDFLYQNAFPRRFTDAPYYGYWWIGLSDSAVEGEWLRKYGCHISYTKWGPGQPNNVGVENCAGFDMRRDKPPGVWNDAPCGTLQPYICEINNVVPECDGTWTGFYDRDDPSATRDEENLDLLRHEYPGQICETPSAVYAETLDGVPATQTGEIIDMSPSTGFRCVNTEQNDGICMDYRVKFCCPGLQCPVGWVPFQSSCYWFSDGEFVTWSVASEACCQLGSVLAVPDSEEENDFLYQNAFPRRFTDAPYYGYWWIGLSDSAVEGEWVGIDGCRISYSKWGPGQPNNVGVENCAGFDMRRDTPPGVWNDAACGTLEPYICEINNVSVTDHQSPGGGASTEFTYTTTAGMGYEGGPSTESTSTTEMGYGHSFTKTPKQISTTQQAGSGLGASTESGSNIGAVIGGVVAVVIVVIVVIVLIVIMRKRRSSRRPNISNRYISNNITDLQNEAVDLDNVNTNRAKGEKSSEVDSGVSSPKLYVNQSSLDGPHDYYNVGSSKQNQPMVKPVGKQEEGACKRGDSVPKYYNVVESHNKTPDNLDEAYTPLEKQPEPKYEQLSQQRPDSLVYEEVKYT